MKLTGVIHQIKALDGSLFRATLNAGGNKMTEVVTQTADPEALTVYTGSVPVTITPTGAKIEDYTLYGVYGTVNYFDKAHAQVVSRYPDLTTGTVVDGSGSLNCHSLLMPLIPGTYTFSIYNPSGSVVRNRHRICCYGTSPTVGTAALSYTEAVVRSGDTVSVTFTAPAGTKYVLLFLWAGSEYTTSVIDGVIENNQIMVEEGTNVSAYVAYHSFNIVISVTCNGTTATHSIPMSYPLTLGRSLTMRDAGVTVPLTSGQENTISASSVLTPRITIMYKG